jgi:hypothetical protein
MDAIAELNITVEADNMEKYIFVVLANIRPSWNPAEVDVKVGFKCHVIYIKMCKTN